MFIDDVVVYIGNDKTIEKGTVGIIREITNHSFVVEFLPNYPSFENSFTKLVPEYRTISTKENESFITKQTENNFFKITEDITGLVYRGCSATVHFSYPDCSLFGRIRNFKDESENYYIFEIDKPENAQKLFEEFIDDLIRQGKIKYCYM